ncbi:MAG: UDP-N-acetylmuramoyl-L-alanyl-D-glutamate--2,6-diaminopimelate ligase [Actinomycetes bacterium]
MLLGEIIPEAVLESGDPEIAALAYDDRLVAPGTLFFCVPGLTRDGHDFAPAAVDRGACALVVERPLGLGVPEVLVDDARSAMGPAAARFHGDPSGKVDVVGITGTNGKTTSAWLVRSLIEGAGRQCGLLGTVATLVGGERRSAVRTTPEAIDLQGLLREMSESGDLAAAIEVSSHALELGRVDGTRFAVAVFTNLTQDHLDFHGTMENYWAAKRRLFDDFAPGASVVNIDDSHGRELAADLEGAITYGTDPAAQWRASEIRSGIEGSTFTLRCPDGEFPVTTLLPGLFNVRNVLGSLAAAHSLGIGTDRLLPALATIGGVPGRFEPVVCGQPFAVLVDYAHTPDSLENVLRAARGLTEGRVICVVGCGGDRDRGKRPLMGGIAAELADVAIVTSDNPRSEEPEAIVAEVAAGAAGRARTVVERAEAIGAAIDAALAGDVVVIAGKGHEQGQEFAGGRVVPFDDREVAAAALADAGWEG